MRQIEKQKTTAYKVWQAEDGTEFTLEEECKKYEESAQGILRARFKKLVVAEENAWTLMGGYEDNTVYTVKFSSMEDVDTLMHLYLLENPHMKEAACQDYMKKYRNMAENALANNDLLLIGENLDGDIYFIDTRGSIIDKLQNLGKEDKDA